MEQATAFLHENGVMLHYEDATLKDLYFLDPQWLCDMLAHVVTIREINPFAPNGELAPFQTWSWNFVIMLMDCRYNAIGGSPVSLQIVVQCPIGCSNVRSQFAEQVRSGTDMGQPHSVDSILTAHRRANYPRTRCIRRSGQGNSTFLRLIQLTRTVICYLNLLRMSQCVIGCLCRFQFDLAAELFDQRKIPFRIRWIRRTCDALPDLVRLYEPEINCLNQNPVT